MLYKILGSFLALWAPIGLGALYSWCLIFGKSKSAPPWRWTFLAVGITALGAVLCASGMSSYDWAMLRFERGPHTYLQFGLTFFWDFLKDLLVSTTLLALLLGVVRICGQWVRRLRA